MITLTDFEVFVRRTFEGVHAVVEDLGDELINDKPNITLASSPFGLVTHIVGACEWWIGHILLGEPSGRVREQEFHAFGTVAELRGMIDAWLASLTERGPRIAATTALAGTPSTQRPLDGEWTVGAVLMHVYEELAQHLGHLEVTADILRAEHGTGSL